MQPNTPRMRAGIHAEHGRAAHTLECARSRAARRSLVSNRLWATIHKATSNSLWTIPSPNNLPNCLHIEPSAFGDKRISRGS